jgi:hypothetical protein
MSLSNALAPFVKSTLEKLNSSIGCDRSAKADLTSGRSVAGSTACALPLCTYGQIPAYNVDYLIKTAGREASSLKSVLFLGPAPPLPTGMAVFRNRLEAEDRERLQQGPVNANLRTSRKVCG